MNVKSALRLLCFFLPLSLGFNAFFISTPYSPPLAQAANAAPLEFLTLSTTTSIATTGSRGVKTRSRRRQQQQQQKNNRFLPFRSVRVDDIQDQREREIATTTTTTTLDQPNDGTAVTIPTWLPRFTVAAASCLLTWAMVTLGNVPSPRASGVSGLTACIMFPPPLAAAALSGAFSGMSTYGNTLSHALTLAGLSGSLYAVESTHPRVSTWLKGKGGRLGTISVFASLILFAVRADKSFYTTIMDWMSRFGPRRNLGALAVAFGILTMVKPTRWDTAQQPFQTEQQSEAIFSLAHKFIVTSAKVAIVALLASLHFQNGGAAGISLEAMTKLLQSAMVMFGCSSLLFASPGPVVSMSLLGIAASASADPALVAQMCVGGLIGMTRLDDFNVVSLLQTSLVASLFLGIGGLDGIGGRLGAFTLLGVVFAMNS